MPRTTLKSKNKISKTAATKKTKKPTKKKIKAKPGDSHVKSFYRPRTHSIKTIEVEESTETRLENMIWVPVALVLAITSIGLNMMLVIYYNQR